MKTVKYKNQIIEVVKVRMEWENKSYWVCLINDKGGDDLFRTQADAIYAGKYIIDNN
jgi:hypothetical protein